MFQESQLDPCSTLEHQARSNNQSQHDLLYGGVSYRQFKSNTCPSALRNSEMANRQGDGNAFATPRSFT